MSRILKVLSFEDAKEKIAENLLKEKKVKEALHYGKILINFGTTNYYIIKQLGIKADYESFCAGRVVEKGFDVVSSEIRTSPYLIDKGIPRMVPLNEGVDLLKENDIFIKGGNLLLKDGTVGVYVLSPTGGTISHIPQLLARGVEIISPLSISKRIPSPPRISSRYGDDPAIFYMKNTTVYTEIDAFLREGYDALYLGINGFHGTNMMIFELLKKEE